MTTAVARHRQTVDAELCVVGAGIVGLAHAHEGRRRGLRVALLERDQRAVGASVRNFGHAFVAAVSDGEDLERALHARERWLELGARAKLSICDAGTLVIARAEDELTVLEGAAANPRRRARMLTAAQAGELAPIPTDEVLGAMLGTLDLRVDPRSAVGGLARLLEEDQGAHVEWGAAVHEIAPGEVRSGWLTVRAPRIVICPGPDFAALPPGARGGLGDLALCKLQMLRIAAPHDRRYSPAQLLHPAQQPEASSGAGDIVLTVPNVAYAVTTSSGVGNITDSSLSIDPGSPRRINASAGAGDVTIQASR
jgi:FAD dependent oxidoreductase TIGR03364